MQRSASYRSRRELSNEFFLAKFGFDTAENEPCKLCPLSAYRSPRCKALREANGEENERDLVAKSLFEDFNEPEDVEIDDELSGGLVGLLHRNREKTKLKRHQTNFLSKDFSAVSAEELEDDAIYKQNGASRWEIEKVRRVFKQFDKDSSGTIDADDMHALLTHLLNGVELC